MTIIAEKSKVNFFLTSKIYDFCVCASFIKLKEEEESGSDIHCCGRGRRCMSRRYGELGVMEVAIVHASFITLILCL